MWEVDIRTSADGRLICAHDADLPDGTPLARLSYTEICAADVAQIGAVPLFEDVLTLAKQTGTGIYADVKDNKALEPVAHMLDEQDISPAVIGAFDRNAVQILHNAGWTGRIATLVPRGRDPFRYARDASVIHLCWERMRRPQDRLTPSFFRRCEERQQEVVLWHEEDPPSYG